MDPKNVIDAIFSNPEVLAQPAFWILLCVFVLISAGVVRWSYKHDYRQLVALRDEAKD